MSNLYQNYVKWQSQFSLFLFDMILTYVKYMSNCGKGYSGVLSEYAKKSGSFEKSEVWNARSLIVPLRPRAQRALENVD